VRLQAPITGGKQERSRRAGTENVAGIVGLGVAAQLAKTKMADEAARLAALRDRLEEGVLRIGGTDVNGARSPRVPNTTNISFDRIEAESLLIALDLAGVAVSTGSACSSGTLEPSHVLKAMGFPPHRTQNSIRFSLGAANTAEDIERVIDVLPGIVDKLRSLTRTPVRA
jgi:cysteine desulfurase